jgi:hypothetical protein
MWQLATFSVGVSNCRQFVGVLLCRTDRHILELHRSSHVSVHLSTCDWILCTGCEMDL